MAIRRWLAGETHGAVLRAAEARLQVAPQRRRGRASEPGLLRATGSTLEATEPIVEPGIGKQAQDGIAGGVADSDTE